MATIALESSHVTPREMLFARLWIGWRRDGLETMLPLAVAAGHQVRRHPFARRLAAGPNFSQQRPSRQRRSEGLGVQGAYSARFSLARSDREAMAQHFDDLCADLDEILFEARQRSVFDLLRHCDRAQEMPRL
jgi:hypothetical protein